MGLGNMQITSKLPLSALMPRLCKVSGLVGLPAMKGQGLLPDRSEPTIVMAMDSSLLFPVSPLGPSSKQFQADPSEVQ